MYRFLFSLCLVLAFSLSWTPAQAQTAITPSDRISTRLNVREEGISDSAIVGKLEKNETAELISEATPRWYHIRLHNGIEGFVSKSWSVKVAAPAVADQRIRLGTWNIKKLGHGSSKDFALVANVIESNFDVLTVIEVMQKQQAHGGYDQLLQQMGTGWAGLITDSPRPNTTAGHAEFYAVLYRPSLVRPCTGWTAPRYHQNNDGSPSGTGTDNFSREPAFVCLEAGFSSGTSGFDFILGAYHATFNGVGTIKAEVGNIDSVFTSMGAAVPGENDLIILGDFNLTPPQLATVTNGADRTTGTGSTMNISGNVTSNLYDHLLVHDEAATSEIVGNARVLDVREVTTTNQLFYQTVSDHLPIVVQVRVAGPDDD